MLSKLTVHNPVIPRLTKRINSHIAKVPVFTTSVACRREASLKIGPTT